MAIWKLARLAAIVLVIVAILALALWPETVEVDVAQVERGAMQVTIDEDGETRVRERFVVSAPVSGRLQRIELEPGDPVVRGKTVVGRLVPTDAPLLDPRTRAELTVAVEAARASVGRARAERDRAAAALDLARTSLQRQEKLAAAGAIARENLDSAQTAFKNAESALRAAEFAVAAAEQELRLAGARLQAPPPAGRAVEVAAPVDGVVLKRLHESELVVPAGEPLIEIGDPQRLEIVADLLSTDAVRVKPGSPVVIEQWGGKHPLHAQVRRVEPSGFMKISALGVEEQRVNVIMDLADPAAAAGALGDGYRVEVRVVVWREDDVVKVPVASLFRPSTSTQGAPGDGEGRPGNDWAVFVVEDGRIRTQIVELGQRNDEEGQIIGGVQPGQTIVLHPPDTLTDGTRVTERGN